MDNELLSQLYHRYQKKLYLYLYSLSKNKSISEDLLQETFLKALLSLSSDHQNIQAWLYAVARNLYFNHLKKEKHCVCYEELDQSPDAGHEEIIDQLIQNDTMKMLYKALENLDLRKREVLQMQYFGGLSQKEIAAILRITPENVRVLSYRAKKELRKYLEGNGYDIS